MKRPACGGPAGRGALLALACALTGAGCAAADPVPAPATGTRDAAQWLRTIQAAALHQNFSGTIVYQHGEDMHASHIVHSSEGGVVRERVLTLDGLPREFIRVGDETQCLYPRLQRVVIEQRARPVFPNIAEPVSAEVSSHYDVRRVGRERVAGSDCEVVELIARDELRYGYRLWVEPASGLLLRAQTLGADGAAIEQVSFTDLHLGEAIDPAQLRPTWQTAGWQVERRPSEPTQLQTQGWRITAPAGFHRLAEVVRRFLGHGAAPAKDGTPAPVVERSTLQAVYSDGLATVSVFIDPSPGRHGPGEERQRRGSVTAVMRQVDDATVTVVGEVPPATAQSIADSVERIAPAH